MELLKLEPACKDNIWGGNKLKTEYGKVCRSDILAETWELSTHPDGSSTISNGEFTGKSFREFIKNASYPILGSNCAKFQDFPILIKFIDAQDKLSIQVHPSDDYALREEKQYGKTEVWYIMDCEADSYIYYGVAKTMTQEEFRNHIQNNTILEVLQKVPVKKGDVFFIEAGTIHAICEGILIAEIQQNSNVTYRVYDYDRRDKEGNPRELHIEKAVAVSDLTPPRPVDTSHGHLCQCEYFTVDKVQWTEGTYQRDITSETFLHALILEGKGTISVNGEELPYNKGDSFFVPARKPQEKARFTLKGTGEILLTTVE